MRAFQVKTVAGALVLLELLAPQAMAAEKKIFDADLCHCNGALCTCPRYNRQIAFTVEQIDALKKVPEPTTTPEAPSSTK